MFLKMFLSLIVSVAVKWLETPGNLKKAASAGLDAIEDVSKRTDNKLDDEATTKVIAPLRDAVDSLP